MSSTIAGHVLNNERRPVGKVKISLKGKVVAETRDDGSFEVRIPKAEPRVAMTFTAEGYVSNTRVYDSRVDTGVNTVIVWPLMYQVRFDPSRDLDIGLGLSRIRIPGNVLTGPGGKNLEAHAELRFTWFDITNPFQRAAASGDFTGQLADGRVCRLNSYGIFDFDIRDPRGGSVQMKKEAAIDLSIAVPPRLTRNAPKSVGFFSFDTLTGIWVQAGSFDFVPSTLTYNGSVRRFGGAHNLDNPQDTTCVTVRVVNFYDGSGMPNMMVTAQGLQYSSYGTTDANGFVCLLVDRNSNFSVTAQGSVGGVFWGTPQPVVLMSPNLSSTASDCGNPTLCPFVGTVPVDFVVGTGVASSL